MKIIVLDGYLVGAGGCSWESLSKQGEFVYYDETTTGDDIAARIGDADAAFTNRCPVSAETIARCPNLKLIHSFGTGYNQIDLDAARERGIVVCNTPGYGRGAVAQMAAALLFAAARNVNVFDHYIKANGWSDPSDPNLCAVRQMELTGKTLGIIGLGDIGYAFARIAMAMDMNVLAYRRAPDLTLESEQLHYTDLDTLLRQSDIISVHCPLNEHTRRLINAEAIGKMKDGAILINTSRGAVLDEPAVLAALDSGKLYAAAVDVFAQEPCGKNYPLACHPRCIATPHVAWMPLETRQHIIDMAGEALRAFLAGSPVYRVV